MVTAVTDVRSNPNDQIAHAANVLKRSARLRTVFVEIYKGGKRKTVAQLMKATGFKQVAVLQAGRRLADEHIIHSSRVKNETVYEKDRFYAANKAKVLRLANNPAKLAKLPTKYNPKSSTGGANIKVTVTGARVQIKQVTCEHFPQFEKIKKVKDAPAVSISEKAFKAGICKLIGESGDFQDWGGERNDLYTTKLKFKGQRRPVAFAFKGPGTTGTLTPKKLGKNGDQIQRLFLSPAEIFIVQYHGQIDQSVIEQMVAFATMNSVREGKCIWYGVIDGDDTRRILAAYPKHFNLK